MYQYCHKRWTKLHSTSARRHLPWHLLIINRLRGACIRNNNTTAELEDL